MKFLKKLFNRIFRSEGMGSKTIWPHFQMLGMSVFISATAMTFMSGYFRQIGFSEMHIGLYGSALGFAVLFCLPGSLIIHTSGNYRKITVIFFAVSALFCTLGVVIGYFSLQISTVIIPIVVIILLLVYLLSWNVGAIVFVSWMHDMVGNNGWQRYYSTRAIVGDSSILLTSLAVGAYLGSNPKAINFLIIFLIAVVFCLFSAYSASRVQSTVIYERKVEKTNYLKIITGILKKKEFRNRMAIIFVRMFAYSLIMPFQPIFLLEKLKLDYTRISIMICISTVASIFAYKVWAYFQRKHGNYTCMKWCLALSIMDPLLWFIATESNSISIYFAFAIFGLAGSGGLINAGLLTSNMGLIFEYSDEKLKSICMSLNSAIESIATLIAPLLGGLLISKFNGTLITIPLIHAQLDGYRLLFAISCTILIVASIIAFVIRRPKHEQTNDITH